MEGLLQIAKNWQRSNNVNKNLEPLPKHERPQILATRKTRLTSGKARQHLIPMLVASLLIPNPNVVIEAKQNIMIAKNNAKLMGNNARNATK